MSLNRRRFLEDSLLATAAALAAGPITSVLAEDEKPAKAANEKLGVACVGTQWQVVISFVVLVLVLMFRPTGLLGEQVGE